MKIASTCTGYGGLDLAVCSVLGGELIWYSEFDKHPSTLLAQHHPDIPNYGDLTALDWHSLERPDILISGYPCQPWSVAGKRLGENDPRHLWPHIREAIRVLRPRLCIFENVAGHRSKGFASVLRDCAEDGHTVRWVSVRASDAGAPHRRERLFFTVSDPESIGWSSTGREQELASVGAGGAVFPDASVSGRERAVFQRGRHEQASQFGGEAAAHSRGVGCDGWSAAPRQTGRALAAVDGLRPTVHNTRIAWGDYEPAIRRWETVLGRPAPDPTEPNKNGKPRLSARFDEWMMGLPEGWVTDSGLPYGAMLKLFGNGVVPQQAELALRMLGVGVERADALAS